MLNQEGVALYNSYPATTAMTFSSHCFLQIARASICLWHFPGLVSIFRQGSVSLFPLDFTPCVFFTGLSLTFRPVVLCVAFLSMFDSFQHKHCWWCSIQPACPSMFRLVTLRRLMWRHSVVQIRCGTVWRHACGRSAEAAAACSILSRLLQSSTFTQTVSKTATAI